MLSLSHISALISVCGCRQLRGRSRRRSSCETSPSASFAQTAVLFAAVYAFLHRRLSLDLLLSHKASIRCPPRASHPHQHDHGTEVRHEPLVSRHRPIVGYVTCSSPLCESVNMPAYSGCTIISGSRSSHSSDNVYPADGDSHSRPSRLVDDPVSRPPSPRATSYCCWVRASISVIRKL